MVTNWHRQLKDDIIDTSKAAINSSRPSNRFNDLSDFTFDSQDTFVEYFEVVDFGLLPTTVRSCFKDEYLK